MINDGRSGRKPDDVPTSTTVGVLACDHVIGDELRAASNGRDYADMYREMLQAAAPTIDTRVHDATQRELPDDPADCDAWIITGSRHDAFSDEPWTVELREFVRRLWAHRARTVGVCFGHQVIAHALGGRTERSTEWKVGPQSMHVDATPWFDGGDVAINAMHRDVVAALPPEARTIATGATAEHPAFIVGDTMLGIQDHPEFDATYISALTAARRDLIGDELSDAAIERAAVDPVHNDIVGRWIADFLLDRRC